MPGWESNRRLFITPPPHKNTWLWVSPRYWRYCWNGSGGAYVAFIFGIDCCCYIGTQRSRSPNAGDGGVRGRREWRRCKRGAASVSVETAITTAIVTAVTTAAATLATALRRSSESFRRRTRIGECWCVVGSKTCTFVSHQMEMEDNVDIIIVRSSYFECIHVSRKRIGRDRREDHG